MGVRRRSTGAVHAIHAGVTSCLVVLLLAGCGGGDDDSVADPPVAPATSSPTASPQRESPEHFIRRWAAEDTRMQNTGETANFRDMSHGCDTSLDGSTPSAPKPPPHRFAPLRGFRSYRTSIW